MSDSPYQRTDLQMYKSLFANHPDGICSIDRKGRLTSCNTSFETWSGYSNDELLQKKFADLLLPEDRLSTMRKFLRPSLNTARCDMEKRVVRKNGEVGWLSLTVVPILMDEEFAGIYVVTRDITERKELEFRLRRQTEMLDHLQCIAHVGSWEFDPIRQGSYWSDELFNIFGISNTGFVTTEEMAQCVFPDDQEFFTQSLNDLASGKSYDTEFRIVRPDDGQIRIIHSRREIIVDRDGEERFIGTAQDVTDRKRTEERLINSEKLASIDQLAAGIAHEIRNPLTSVKGFLYLLKSKYGTVDEHYFDIIQTELKRIELISSELLTIGRPQVLSFVRKDVLEILQNIVKLFDGELKKHNITVVWQISPCTPIMCAEEQLHQAFVNIVRNAIEAMENGGELRIGLEPKLDRVCIDIADTGMGLSKELLKRVGDPFFTTKPAGSGLGLMITKSVIQRHNGWFGVDSEEQHGTVIQVELPISQSVTNNSQAN